MTQKVLVVGHADADGHIISEQVRRNLSLIPGFDVNVVVDPDRTKDHKAWMKLNELGEIDGADTVFFVDMMFAPASFDDEARALVSFVRDYPGKQFFLIDHHPLPARRLADAQNLRSIYRSSVFDCVIGPRSGMMIAAAICENQATDVADIKQPVHDIIAQGTKRAAALGGDLPGARLLALLRSDRWDSLLALGEDDKSFHYLPRGRRQSGSELSPAMISAIEVADEVLTVPAQKQGSMEYLESGRKTMAYDFDIAQEKFETQNNHRARVSNYPVYRRDLETIVTILEVAALSLTTFPEETFTSSRLLEEAKKFGGDEIEFEDIQIVLKKFGFLKGMPGGELRLK